jgi:hypothetical protein
METALESVHRTLTWQHAEMEESTDESTADRRKEERVVKSRLVCRLYSPAEYKYTTLCTKLITHTALACIILTYGVLRDNR